LTPRPPAAKDLDEAALVAAVLQKNRKATAEFLARFADPVYSYLCRRLLPREDLVEDLFQQVLLEAWQSLSRWRGDSELASWLLGIARHKVVDLFRTRLREVELDEEDIPDSADWTDPADWLAAKDRDARVAEVLGLLPEQSRMLLLWRYWERRGTAEMAAELGKTVKSVERSLARARSQFRRFWQEGGGDV
jgi:RNA polymerase sigma-70 factor, ECF subfamily